MLLLARAEGCLYLPLAGHHGANSENFSTEFLLKD